MSATISRPLTAPFATRPCACCKGHTPVPLETEGHHIVLSHTDAEKWYNSILQMKCRAVLITPPTRHRRVSPVEDQYTPDQPIQKQCVRCKGVYPLASFHRRGCAPDGLNPACKACIKQEDAARWRNRTPEQRAKDKARDDERRKGEREARQERSRQYRKENLDKVLGINLRYRERNREAVRASERRRRENNRLRYRAYKAKWRALRSGAKVGRVNYQAIWDRDGGTCYLCGQPIDRANVHFDHVRPLSKGGEHSMANIRPTHPFCNISKKDRYDG